MLVHLATTCKAGRSQRSQKSIEATISTSVTSPTGSSTARLASTCEARGKSFTLHMCSGQLLQEFEFLHRLLFLECRGYGGMQQAGDHAAEDRFFVRLLLPEREVPLQNCCIRGKPLHQCFVLAALNCALRCDQLRQRRGIYSYSLVHHQPQCAVQKPPPQLTMKETASHCTCHWRLCIFTCQATRQHATNPRLHEWFV